MLEHALEPLARDVTLGLAVNRVTDGHVIGRNGLGNRPGRAADFKKPARHFLPRTDFGKRAVTRRIQIYLESLLIRGQLGKIMPHVPPIGYSPPETLAPAENFYAAPRGPDNGAEWPGCDTRSLRRASRWAGGFISVAPILRTNRATPVNSATAETGSSDQAQAA